MKKSFNEMLATAILFALAMLAVNSCRAQTTIVFNSGDKPPFATIDSFLQWEASDAHRAQQAAFKPYHTPVYLVALPAYIGANFYAMQVRRNLCNAECAVICGCTVQEWERFIDRNQSPFATKAQMDKAYCRLFLTPKKR